MILFGRSKPRRGKSTFRAADTQPIPITPATSIEGIPLRRILGEIDVSCESFDALVHGPSYKRKKKC